MILYASSRSVKRLLHLDVDGTAAEFGFFGLLQDYPNYPNLVHWIFAKVIAPSSTAA